MLAVVYASVRGNDISNTEYVQLSLGERKPSLGDFDPLRQKHPAT